MIKREKVYELFNKFNELAPVTRKLNSLGVPWLIGGSGCLFLLGNDRMPGDIDIFLEDKSHDLVDREFGVGSFEYKSEIETVRNSNPEENHGIQFTSHLKLNLAGKSYDLGITQNTIAHRLSAEWKSEKIYLLPPEEVMLIKALLQRGVDQGKHDVEDITVFLSIYPKIDREYLHYRVLELNAEERVDGILKFGKMK